MNIPRKGVVIDGLPPCSDLIHLSLPPQNAEHAARRSAACSLQRRRSDALLGISELHSILHTVRAGLETV